jgi:hypothetical protein
MLELDGLAVDAGLGGGGLGGGRPWIIPKFRSATNLGGGWGGGRLLNDDNDDEKYKKCEGKEKAKLHRPRPRLKLKRLVLDDLALRSVPSLYQ